VTLTPKAQSLWIGGIPDGASDCLVIP
jgi:hypothetical protein